MNTLPHLVHLPVILRFHHQLNDNHYLPKDPNNLHCPQLDNQLQHSHFNNTILDSYGSYASIVFYFG